jgi:hypothetical protein
LKNSPERLDVGASGPKVNRKPARDAPGEA